MSEAFLLSEGDQRVLRDIVSKVRRLLQAAPNRPDELEAIDSAPDMYVVQPPPGGIPWVEGNTPGSAVCSSFQMVNGTLIAAYPSPIVYNLTGGVIPHGAWVLAVQDKFGQYYAVYATNIEDISGDPFCVPIRDACTDAIDYFYYDGRGGWIKSDVPCPQCVGTGTGSGSTPCVCSTAHLCISGLTLVNEGCDLCGTLTDITLISEFDDGLYSAGPCNYANQFLWGCGVLYHIVAIITQTLQWLQVQVGFVGTVIAEYEHNGPWTCSSTILLTKVFPVGSGPDINNTCSNWPDVLMLTPGICSGDTGTGTGGPPAPTILWYDTFTDPDNTALVVHTPDVGTFYTTFVAGLQIQGDQLANGKTAGDSWFDVAHAAPVTLTVQFQFNSASTGIVMSFWVCFDGTNSGYQVTIDDFGLVHLYAVVAGSQTLVASGAISSFSSTQVYTLTFKVTTTPQVKVSITPGSVNLVYSTAFGFLDSNTGCRLTMDAQFPSLMRFDNLEVTTP